MNHYFCVKTKTALSIVAGLLVLIGFGKAFVYAEIVTTTVTTVNNAPEFTVLPEENPASNDSNPILAGNSLSFKATVEDPNGENYYLAICKTNAITPVPGGAPVCTGGSYCVSSVTTSGAQTTCSYTTLAGDPEVNEWYAFACDNNVMAPACTSSSQGSGDSGSPFTVNHTPTFAAISNDGPHNPGEVITWSTSASTTDSDTQGTTDTVKLIVCSVPGLSGDNCTGGDADKLCASEYVTSSPSCTYTLPLPLADKSYNAYVYLIDNHQAAATGVNQGSNSSYVVNNITPVVSATNINGGASVHLVENSTTQITLTGIVTDNNGCTDITTVVGNMYRSGITLAGCDASSESDPNHCYPLITCSASGSNPCSGENDSNVTYACMADVSYFADPTDSSSQFPDDTWLGTVQATDNNGASHRFEMVSGVEMNSLVAMDITAAIVYGNLPAGQKNDPLDKITTIAATGNVGLDEELSGTNMISGPNSIAVSNQRFALAANTAYSTATALSTIPIEAELNCPKTKSVLQPAMKNTWWGILIPIGTKPGIYSGANTVVAVRSEASDW